MSDYRPPIDDIVYTLEEVAGLGDLAALDAFSDLDADFVRAALEEAGRFTAEVIGSIHEVSDDQGSRLTDEGEVVTPDGFREAYGKFVESGWPAAAFPEEWGGGGMPFTVGLAVQEMVTSADMAFSLCPMLTFGAVELLLEYGTPEQQATYLEKLVTGEWTGTMVLTEPQAGSDLGALTTRAVRADDGTYRITGQKIYITWGDHDLTDNIVHLVLARTPDAPPGTRGISCFIVPKYLVDADGTPGERNDITTVSLEHKLGIHASPTCVLSFGDEGDGAVGYLVGEEQQGMRYMFLMMNNARLQVGVEGLGVAERVLQQSAAFARDRRQGRAVGAPKTESSPIVEHPDVRRMLMLLRARVEAMRGVMYRTARMIDLRHHAATDAERERADEVAAILTPVSKAWGTDLGVECANLGIQVHGGMGYIEETGAARLLRDVRIAPIYEGTNGIQAADLATRKLPMRDGAAVGDLLDEMRATAKHLAATDEATAGALTDAVEALAEASEWLLGRFGVAPNDTLAGATPYLEMFGITAGGWALGLATLAARRRLGTDGADEAFLRDKIATTRFYAEHELPRVRGLLASATAGAGTMFEVDADRLG
ncbi:MAG: acyl-CoA dehydrogenase [Acidimicrobiia bacterium]|nr:acyl-CoA dehydrogenase [Acidimicrobiia bacterium]